MTGPVPALPAPMADGRGLRLAAVALAGVVQAVLLGVAAFATRDAFAAIHAGSAPSAATLAALAGAGVAAAACEGAARVTGEAVGQRYASAVRVAVYAALARWPRAALRERRLGALSLRFVGDLSAVRLWFGRALPGLVASCAALPGVALVLVLLDPRAGALALAAVAASLAAMALAAWGLRRRHRRLRARRASVAVAAVERLEAAPELDLLGRTPKELALLARGGDRLREGAVARERRTALLRLIPQAGTAAGAALVLALAGGTGPETGTAAAMLAMLAILGLQLRDLADALDAASAWSVARGKLLVVLERAGAPRRAVPRGGPVALSVRAPTASFDVPPGGLARLAGPAASGKSHLAAVVAGLDRDPGIALGFDGGSERPHAAHVGDRPPVLRGSLRRTLTLGIDPRPSTNEVERAARAFGLASLLVRIGGVRGRVGSPDALSGGEALRVALARTALARPDLVVIDSAAFRADPEARALLARLREATGATVLVVGEGPGEPCDAVVRLPSPDVDREEAA